MKRRMKRAVPINSRKIPHSPAQDALSKKLELFHNHPLSTQILSSLDRTFILGIIFNNSEIELRLGFVLMAEKNSFSINANVNKFLRTF